MLAIVIDHRDNVATALRDLNKGVVIVGREIGGDGEGKEDAEVELLDDVPFGHKFALEDIAKGEGVIYGGIIGTASIPIKKGECVHVHNIEGRWQ